SKRRACRGFVLRLCIRKADEAWGETALCHGLADTRFCRTRSRVTRGETSQQEGPDRARSVPLGRREIQQCLRHRPSGCPANWTAYGCSLLRCYSMAVTLHFLGLVTDGTEVVHDLEDRFRKPIGIHLAPVIKPQGKQHLES